MPHKIKPPLALEIDEPGGNAFYILARAKRAALRAGWTEEDWNAVQNMATSGNYEHLLAVMREHFEIADE
jgi:hypothetical protein